MQCLPVNEVLDDVWKALRSAPHACVLVAPPGAGKTTTVPLALLKAGDGTLPDTRGVVIVTEPRRVAARAAACRMAALCDELVGELVGFRTRFESCWDPRRTRIQVVTDGVLAGQIQADPTLAGVSAVVLDEFHERGLGSDVNLAMCVHARKARQAAGLPPLRVIVMSATLAPPLVARLQQQLGGAHIVSAEGRAYHVDVRHVLERSLMLRSRVEKKKDVERAAASAVGDALQETEGNVLCFMPGEMEIKRTIKLIEQSLPKAAASVQAAPKRKQKAFRGFGAAPPPAKVVKPVDVVPLYGALDAEAQDRAVRAGPEDRRKVVVATNVAEASITVAGVTAVVDAGLQKRSRFQQTKGMNVLETVPISKSSADQRAGRAGRVRDGICLRLWNATSKLVAEDKPEIQQIDLTDTVLSLAASGVAPGEIENLPWLDAPRPTSVEYAVQVLRNLGALDPDCIITEHGKALARLPLHPRLSHMALSAQPGDDNADVASLCALLEEDRDVIATDQGQSAAPKNADVRARLQALRGSLLDSKAVRVLSDRCARVRLVANDIRAALPAGCMRTGDVGLMIARAFPERVAVRGKGGTFRLKNGDRCTVEDPNLMSEECLAVARLKGSIVTLAVPLSMASRAAMLASAFNLNE